MGIMKWSPHVWSPVERRVRPNECAHGFMDLFSVLLYFSCTLGLSTWILLFLEQKALESRLIYKVGGKTTNYREKEIANNQTYILSD